MSKVHAFVFGALMAVLARGPARAENPRVNTETFRPSPHARAMFATVTSDARASGAWSFGLWLAYGMNPLVFVDALDVAPDHEAIQHQVSANAVGAYTITDWLSVGLAVPVLLLNSGEDAGFVPLDPIPSAALGDVRASAKIGIVRRDKGADGLGLALELPIGLPTGDGDAFISDGFSFVPAIALDVRLGGFIAAVNLGARVRETVKLAGGTSIGHEVIFRVAASYELVPELLTALGEVQGASHNFALANNTYVEGLLGGRLDLGDGLFVTLAGGRGFVDGYGSTAAKVVASFGYAEPDVGDSDGDGLFDDVDPCPTVAEDVDGVEDGDGCPEDDDKDGIEDLADRCRLVPEDRDGFEDDDGCPDDDNDQDKLLDLADGPDGSCRDAAEDFDGWQDEDGCPDPDNDDDGKNDPDDPCPNDPKDTCRVVVTACEIKIEQTIHFAYDGDVILEKSFAIVEAVAAVLATRPTIKRIEVQGHTDNHGDAEYNLDLSRRRAEAVVAHLVSKGIAAERLVAAGYGETRPLVSNDVWSRRAQNRRVQFIILDPAQSECR